MEEAEADLHIEGTLDGLNRKELLSLTKKYGLKGSGSNQVLRDRLLEHKESAIHETMAEAIVEAEEAVEIGDVKDLAVETESKDVNEILIEKKETPVKVVDEIEESKDLYPAPITESEPTPIIEPEMKASVVQPRLTKSAILRAQSIKSRQQMYENKAAANNIVNTESQAHGFNGSALPYKPYTGPIKPWPAIKKINTKSK
jgi:hypothetical protein